ncbi:hypothetical protein DNTS_020601, partial [Danionella cerebrum]
KFCSDLFFRHQICFCSGRTLKPVCAGLSPSTDITVVLAPGVIMDVYCSNNILQARRAVEQLRIETELQRMKLQSSLLHTARNRRGQIHS